MYVMMSCSDDVYNIGGELSIGGGGRFTPALPRSLDEMLPLTRTDVAIFNWALAKLNSNNCPHTVLEAHEFTIWFSQ